MIINEVEVSGCPFLYKDGTMRRCSAEGLKVYCCQNKDCEYKKDKRKEELLFTCIRECNKKYTEECTGLDCVYAQISTVMMMKELKAEKDILVEKLKEIKQLANVSPCNSCWTSMNLCLECDSKESCELQSPWEKLSTINNIIKELNIEE